MAIDSPSTAFRMALLSSPAQLLPPQSNIKSQCDKMSHMSINTVDPINEGNSFIINSSLYYHGAFIISGNMRAFSE